MKDLLKSRAAGIVYIVIAIALVALWITYLNRWNIALSSIGHQHGLRRIRRQRGPLPHGHMP